MKRMSYFDECTFCYWTMFGRVAVAASTKMDMQMVIQYDDIIYVAVTR